MANFLTASLEDYLEAIAELIAINGHAHTKEIAEKLHVKMPSVTGALRQLEKLSLIIYNTHYPVQLTPAGEMVAHEVMHRHKVLKAFLSGILGIPPDKATTAACHLEHVIDADTIRRFVLFSEAIEKRCDAKSLQIYLAEAMELLDSDPALQLLRNAAPGTPVTIVRLGRNLNDPAALPLAEGDVVIPGGLDADRQIFRFSQNGTDGELPLTAAENIWVRGPGSPGNPDADMEQQPGLINDQR